MRWALAILVGFLGLGSLAVLHASGRVRAGALRPTFARHAGQVLADPSKRLPPAAKDPALMLAEAPGDREHPAVLVLATAGTPAGVSVTLMLRNTTGAVIQGRIWGLAQFEVEAGQTLLVGSDPRIGAGNVGELAAGAFGQAYRARVKTSKTLSFARPDGVNGRFVAFDVYVSDDVFGSVTRYRQETRPASPIDPPAI